MGTLHILVEVRIGRDDQLAVILNRCIVRFQGALKGVEILVLIVGLGVNSRRFGVSPTADLQRFALRAGADFFSSQAICPRMSACSPSPSERYWAATFYVH